MFLVWYDYAMTVHFICRGNAFRSFIAEAYLKSLNLDGVSAISSGTVADKYRIYNQQYLLNTIRLLERHGVMPDASKQPEQLTPGHIDKDQLVVCMNEAVADEARHIVTLPDKTMIWNIADIGEPGRIVGEKNKDRRELEDEVYAEIIQKIDQLVREIT